jgi:hypothetical protein
MHSSFDLAAMIDELRSSDQILAKGSNFPANKNARPLIVLKKPAIKWLQKPLDFSSLFKNVSSRLAFKPKLSLSLAQNFAASNLVICSDQK